MRRHLKNFKEFRDKTEWHQYVMDYMSNANMSKEKMSGEIHITTNQGTMIARWQPHGYGYVEECRSEERLDAQLKNKD